MHQFTAALALSLLAYRPALLLPCLCYRCKTASYTSTTNNWCLLHTDKALAGKQASYCYSPVSIWAGNMFPTKPAFP
jgi:hypothetical protein